MTDFKRKKPLAEQIIDRAKRKPPTKPLQQFIPSGSTWLDLALGGGFPLGKIINIVGDKSTGKTLLALESIAKNRQKHKEKLRWVYDDAECGMSFDTQQIYGFELNESPKRKLINSNTIEEFRCNFRKSIDDCPEDEILIYVLDCFDSLTCDAEIKRVETQKDGYKTEKTKALGEFFRLRKKELKNKNCVLIIISQVRQNIGVMFGEKYYRTGGKALDHYASQIIWLAVADKLRQKGIVTGVTIKAKVKKNKVGKPFREAVFNILFDYGIDDLGSCIDYLYDLRTDKGKLKRRDEQFVGEKNGKKMTRGLMIEDCEDNEEEDVLISLTKKKWQDIEKEIAPNRKAKYVLSRD